MLKRIPAIILIALMIINTVAFTAFANTENAVLSNLENTYYKLTAKKQLNVGFIGGSITVGSAATNVNKTSYRGLVTQWFKDNFATATITSTMAAIGGTGSRFGLYRADNLSGTAGAAGLNLKNSPPDLTFIEFAINDVYDQLTAEESSLYMESLVNKLYAANQNMDIVMLLTTDFSRKDTDFDSKVKFKDIAKRYGIYCIDMGKALYEKALAENNNVEFTSVNDEVWAKYFADIVHPTDAGHAEYANSITAYLSSVLTGDAPAELTVKVLPEPINTNLVTDGYEAYMNTQGYSAYGNQWTIDETTGAISATQAGQKFEFTFTGTRLEVRSNAEEAYGELKYTIDGQQYSKSLYHAGNIVTLAEGLTAGEHTVVIETGADTVPDGKTLTINAFCIAGDADKKGITITCDDLYNYTVINPADSIYNVNFTDTEYEVPGMQEGKISLAAQYTKDGTNDTGLKPYRMPLFVKYDISGLTAENIDKAAILSTVSSADDNLLLYDVPGNDLTLNVKEANKDFGNGNIRNTYKIIEITETSFVNKAYKGKYYASSFPGRPSENYMLDIDIKDYLLEKIEADENYATIMIYKKYTSRNTYGSTDELPVLWVKTAKSTDIPVVDFTLDASYFAETDINLNVTVTAENEITDTAIYVDDVKYDTTIENSGKTYTATVKGLEEGSRMITFKATDTYGIVGEKSVDIEVKPLWKKSEVITYDVAFNYNGSAITNVKTTTAYNGSGIGPKKSNSENIQAYYQFDISSLKQEIENIDKIYFCVGYHIGANDEYKWSENNEPLTASTESIVPDLDSSASEYYQLVPNVVKVSDGVFTYNAPTIKTVYSAGGSYSDALEYPSAAAKPYSTQIYKLNKTTAASQADSLFGSDPYYGRHAQTNMAVDATGYILNELNEGSDRVIINSSCRYNSTPQVRTMPWLYVQYKTPLVFDDGSDKLLINAGEYVSEFESGVNVIVAAYDADNVLIKTVDVKTYGIDGSADGPASYTVTLPVNAETYSVYIWDGETMEPLCDKTAKKENN